MYYQRIWAQINAQNKIENIMVCDDYYTANYLTNATYGEGSYAVEVNLWRVAIGDTYKNGVFYRGNTDEQCEYLPDVENRLQQVEDNSNAMTLLMADLIGV